jgi:hypothetical protein
MEEFDPFFPKMEERACPLRFYPVYRKIKQEGTAYLNLGDVPRADSKLHLRRFKRALGAQEYACPMGSTGFLHS